MGDVDEKEKNKPSASKNKKEKKICLSINLHHDVNLLRFCLENLIIFFNFF